jgi:malonate-semialdehyde dehydrogenase (acetylating) / methylmalonate-semialdehyde dehydrogenase
MEMQDVYHYWGGQWHKPQGTDSIEVHDPALGQPIATLNLATEQEVNQAVEAAHKAFQSWRRVPVTERVQPLFRLKAILERDFEALARTITLECGKTLAESRGEMRRAIENVETACGTPYLIQSAFNESIAPGIDEFSIRQPLGVAALLCPFNFPGMIPFWFLPYAIAVGCTVVIKPSERVPLTMQMLMQLMQESGLPEGVVNVINGGRATSEQLIAHPLVKSISFVGSSAAARNVYLQAATHGKRVQCQGGAKNPVVILPDADIETSTAVIADSAFGCAGQRCLAASVAILVGDANKPFGESLRDAAATRKTGNGFDDVQMGPVISQSSKQRIASLLDSVNDNVSIDGRQHNLDQGYFLKPTILENLDDSNPILRTEIFGPVLTLIEKPTIEDAIAFVNSGAYGNMACLFTRSGEAARRFRTEAEVGNVGINVGVAAPMSFFPFSGARESFFGDLHGQGKDAIRFFTNEKVVVERWPKEWSRKF